MLKMHDIELEVELLSCTYQTQILHFLIKKILLKISHTSLALELQKLFLLTKYQPVKATLIMTSFVGEQFFHFHSVLSELE